MENLESILLELKKISYLLSKGQAHAPSPIYLNQKEKERNAKVMS